MTIEDIARELDVSKSTVSRALSGKGRISETTRLRIQTYAREHGMRMERAQTGQAEPVKTHSIAVVVPADAYTVSIPFFHESLLGVSEVAGLHGYDVVITSGTASDVSGVQTLVENGRVDGVILLRSVEDDRILKYLNKMQFPTGLIGSCEYKEVIQVDTDNREASEDLTTFLIRQGYQRFALVLGNTTYQVNKERSKGYFNALEKQGIPRERQLFYPNFINMELNESVISDIFAKKAECIVCGDDVICTRIMSGMQAKGYRIPKDISIVSMYNSAYLECLSPAVTTVNTSARRMGNLIGKHLISRLEGEPYQDRTILDYEILNRRSTRKDMGIKSGPFHIDLKV